ncbi:MAG: SRPBCC domain-containing protein [Pseudomonadota bacterium]|jgi:uncharacterized protein YndB with AHSA1/START domain
MHAPHTASRTILATPRAIFRAFLDAEVVGKWRPPAGMRAEIYSFEPHVGGGYRMAFVHEATGVAGKSGDDRDAFTGRFVELVPETRIVEEVDFDAIEPAFSGTMRITTQLTPVMDGTKVTLSAENVPIGISAEDHRRGMESSLKNLAMLLE